MVSNRMDRGAWPATFHGVAKSWTQLSNWTTDLIQLFRYYNWDYDFINNLLSCIYINLIKMHMWAMLLYFHIICCFFPKGGQFLLLTLLLFHLWYCPSYKYSSDHGLSSPVPIFNCSPSLKALKCMHAITQIYSFLPISINIALVI